MVEVVYTGLLVAASLGAAWMAFYVVYRLLKGRS